MRWIALLLLLNSIVTTTQAEQEKENWIYENYTFDPIYATVYKGITNDDSVPVIAEIGQLGPILAKADEWRHINIRHAIEARGKTYVLAEDTFERKKWKKYIKKLILSV